MANIVVLGGKFKSTAELQKYSDAQFLAIQSALEKIKKLEEEITHLQQLLAETTQLIGNVTKTIKSPELAVCEAQIELLQNRALTKELTLEEVKTLDLLIKNKRLLSGDPTTIEGKRVKKPKVDYSEAELVKIASQQDKKNG